MGTLIDSSIIVAAERKTLDLEALLANHADDTVAFASITASELLHGVHRASTQRQRNRREAFVEHLLAAIPIAPFDLTVARIHARVWAELARKGVNLGAHDLQIAATALALGYRVATRDKRSFPRVPGLEVTIW